MAFLPLLVLVVMSSVMVPEPAAAPSVSVPSVPVLQQPLMTLMIPALQQHRQRPRALLGH
jgi:hypothetical protein